jgi:hypothetical protein
MGAETIYVELLDEGVDVWRPVEAEPLGTGDDKARPRPNGRGLSIRGESPWRRNAR